MLTKQKVIGTYINYKLWVLLKAYQVKTSGMNKPELRDSWKDILYKMDPHPPRKK